MSVVDRPLPGRARRRVLGSALAVLLVGGLGATSAPGLLQPAAAAPAAAPGRAWEDASQSPDARAAQLLAAMTLEEKVDLMTGNQGEAPTAYYNAPIPRLGIPSLRMADASSGIANRGWTLPGTGGSATAMPSGVALGATFDPDLARRYAGVVADEAKQTGHNMLLGPNADIVRSPFWGRISETESEDTFLTSSITTPYVAEVQAREVIADLKHYVAYNQETNRGNSQNSVVSERALREVYLPPYAAAIEEAGLGSVMCSFNRINGTFSCENSDTLDKILREDLGFSGFVITDFGAIHSTVPSIVAGTDMETGTASFYDGALLAAVQGGQVPVSLVDRSVLRILRTMFAIGLFENDYSPTALPVREHGLVARNVEEQAVTLLKNAGGLPLVDRAQSIAVIGADATTTANPGGAPHVIPTYQVPLLQGMQERAARNGSTVTYARGNDPVNAANMLETGDLTAVPSSVLTPAAGPGNGLTASYFAGTTYAGAPAVTRTEDQVTYDTGFTGGQPAFASLYASQKPATPALDNAFGADQSVRYTGSITAPTTGTYRLSLTGWGDARIFLDDQLVVDMTGTSGRRVVTSAPLTLQAGQARAIRVEYAATRPLNSLEPGTLLMQWSTPAGATSPGVQAAAAAAAAADVAVVYVRTYETEQRDRVSLKLPQGADQLIAAVRAANPDTVVVLATAGAVTMPWLDTVPAVVQGYFGGQEEGGALARVLFGDVNPSGHLPITYPRGDAAVPTGAGTPWATENTQDVAYSEDMFVGYKGYDRQGIAPLFPFGHGLSYTSFAYRDLSVQPTPSGLEARFTVTNTGSLRGAAVPQVYLGAPANPEVPLPVRSLVGFERVELSPGESRQVTVAVPLRQLSYWSQAAQAWRVPSGARTLQVGSSSRDLPLSAADATAGVFSPVLSRSPDRNGWYTAPVTVSGQLVAAGGTGTCTPVTYRGPDGADVAVTVTCSTPGGATSTHVVRLDYDATDPRVRVRKPARPQAVASWQTVRGTAVAGPGSPLDQVEVRAAQQRAGRWFAYTRGAWRPAPNRARALSRATALTATVQGRRWLLPVTGLRRGVLVVRATATDEAGNTARTTRSQRLRR